MSLSTMNEIFDMFGLDDFKLTEQVLLHLGTVRPTGRLRPPSEGHPDDTSHSEVIALSLSVMRTDPVQDKAVATSRSLAVDSKSRVGGWERKTSDTTSVSTLVPLRLCNPNWTG